MAVLAVNLDCADDALPGVPPPPEIAGSLTSFPEASLGTTQYHGRYRPDGCGQPPQRLLHPGWAAAVADATELIRALHDI
jgi:hypothetical protein